MKVKVCTAWHRSWFQLRPGPASLSCGPLLLLSHLTVTAPRPSPLFSQSASVWDGLPPPVTSSSSQGLKAPWQAFLNATPHGALSSHPCLCPPPLCCLSLHGLYAPVCTAIPASVDRKFTEDRNAAFILSVLSLFASIFAKAMYLTCERCHCTLTGEGLDGDKHLLFTRFDYQGMDWDSS